MKNAMKDALKRKRMQGIDIVISLPDPEMAEEEKEEEEGAEDSMNSELAPDVGDKEEQKVADEEEMELQDREPMMAKPAVNGDAQQPAMDMEMLSDMTQGQKNIGRKVRDYWAKKLKK